MEKSCDLSERAGPEHRQAPVFLDRCRSAAFQVGQLEDLVWGLSLFKCAFLCLSSVMLLQFFVCLVFVFNEKGLCMELVMTSVQSCCPQAVHHLSFLPSATESIILLTVLQSGQPIRKEPFNNTPFPHPPSVGVLACRTS